MKKPLLLLSILACLFFVNCSEDDSDDFLSPLVGTWETTSLTSSGCNDPQENGTLTCTGAPCFELTINSNGTYSFQDNTEDPVTTETGTIEVTATTFSACETGETDCSADPYTIDGDELTVMFQEDDSPGCTFTVVFNRST